MGGFPRPRSCASLSSRASARSRSRRAWASSRRLAGENQFAGRPARFGGVYEAPSHLQADHRRHQRLCLAGGMELALTCDIRICTPEARFGLPEVRWAIMPGAGGTQRMPRAIPQAWANYLILTADQMDAETARQIGLVSHIVPREELMDRAMQIANTICERGPLRSACCEGGHPAGRGYAARERSGLRGPRPAAAHGHGGGGGGGGGVFLEPSPNTRAASRWAPSGFVR